LPAELEEIAPLLVGSGTAGLAWWRIRHSSLADTRAGQELRAAFRLQVLHDAMYEARLKAVVTDLHDAGVEPILLKGWTVGRLYPASGLRPSGDIDLHVAPDLYEAAERVLTSSRGTRYDVDLSHEESDLLYLSWHDALAHSQQVELGDTAVRVMGPEHHLVLLCMHFLKHGGWRPLWLCDIALALESRSSSFDWELCLGPMRGGPIGSRARSGSPTSCWVRRPPLTRWSAVRGVCHAVSYRPCSAPGNGHGWTSTPCRPSLPPSYSIRGHSHRHCRHGG
jgi:Uncharacterised nucleotidyltransferase